MVFSQFLRGRDFYQERARLSSPRGRPFRRGTPRIATESPAASACYNEPLVATTRPAIPEQTAFLKDLQVEIGTVIVGQEKLVRRLLVALLADGHVLLEGVPGLAKTLLVSTLAQTLSVTFRRIQFTPDLLPSDVTGTPIYNPKTGEFTIKPGPIFANIVLADEINRAPAKVQSALLEAMQERQVTLGDKTFRLAQPFLVLATQNPIEQEGTYPLPEAQLDRFLLKLIVHYPTRDDEREVVDRMAKTGAKPTARAIATKEQLAAARAGLDEVKLDPKLRDYIVDLVRASREPGAHGLKDLVPMIANGASPRASIALALAARAHALLAGRAFVIPQDVKSIAPDVLRHRVILSYEAEAEEVDADKVIARLLDTVPVP
jgi:MoxR-like ATPase